MNRKLRLPSYFILLMCIVLLSSGCMGMIMRSIAIDGAGTYAELSETLPAIPEGKGRLFIYMVDGGPSVLNTLGIVAEAFTIDNDIRFISGKTFFYVDLSIEKHEVTASRVITGGVFKKTFNKGENRVDFVLSNQQAKYIKIDFRGYIGTPRFGTYHPIILESSQIAETEIDNLRFYTDYKRGMGINETQKVGDIMGR